MATRIDIEATGANFSVAKQLDVRARTHKALRQIAANIMPGMVEEDAAAMAREVLGTMDMRKGWHRVIVRFGPNTTKDFMAKSEPGVVLGEQDIFFIDIGPVYGETEGDAGETFMFGDDPHSTSTRSSPRRDAAGSSTWICLATGCRSFPTKRTTTVRSPTRICTLSLISGSSKWLSGIRLVSSVLSTKTCCSTTSPSTTEHGAGSGRALHERCGAQNQTGGRPRVAEPSRKRSCAQPVNASVGRLVGGHPQKIGSPLFAMWSRRSWKLALGSRNRGRWNLACRSTAEILAPGWPALMGGQMP
jgi:Metallopeptidase family M24